MYTLYATSLNDQALPVIGFMSCTFLLNCLTPARFVVQLLMTRPRDEWRHDVASRYRALEQFSKEDARLQFLRILRSLPYGESPCMADLAAPETLLGPARPSTLLFHKILLGLLSSVHACKRIKRQSRPPVMGR